MSASTETRQGDKRLSNTHCKICHVNIFAGDLIAARLLGWYLLRVKYIRSTTPTLAVNEGGIKQITMCVLMGGQGWI